jgi:hypothetical protein
MTMQAYIPSHATRDLGCVTARAFCGAPCLADALSTAGVLLTEGALRLLDMLDGLQTNAQEVLDLIAVPLRDMDVTSTAQLSAIYRRARAMGLGLCPPEVGPALAMQCPPRAGNASMRIAMWPLSCDSASEVFWLGRSKNQPCLGTRFGLGTHRPCDPDMEFVFRRRG